MTQAFVLQESRPVFHLISLPLNTAVRLALHSRPPELTDWNGPTYVAVDGAYPRGFAATSSILKMARIRIHLTDLSELRG